MSTFKKFEEIQAWQKARTLTKDIYLLSGSDEFGKDFDLRRQIRRSSMSIMANIAEGQGRRTDKEFANFLNMALGSVAETKSQMYLALDLRYVNESEFNGVYGRLDELGRMIFGLNAHLRTSQTYKTATTS